ncbi:MAG: SH3 domain-containing protein [Paracoccaceae bacterium]
MNRAGIAVLVAGFLAGSVLAQEAPPPRPAHIGAQQAAPAAPDADVDGTEGLETVDGVQDVVAPTQDAQPVAIHSDELQGPPLPPAQTRRKVKPRDPTRGAVTNLPLPRYVSLKSSEGNARRGPGLSHRVDWVFKRAGMPLRVTAEYEHWRRVEDADGVGGWVNFALISGVRTILVTQNMAEFHSRADDQSQVVFEAEANVVGKLLECLPDWCRVSIEGEKGWARKTALWGVDPGEVLE